MDPTAIGLDTIFQYIGLLSTISFVLVGFGDFVTAAISIVVRSFCVQSRRQKAAKLLYRWGTFKEVYEEFRKFADRFSTFSRPRE